MGGDDYRIRSLRDRQQYWDPEGEAERAGISSASWPLFGLVWPIGLQLAGEMSRFAFAGKRILEVGCGLGLSSLVLSRRQADVTASDYHPLAGEFLRINAELNGLPPIPYRRASWADADVDLGLFDLIVGSDVLYERDHPGVLAEFVARHSAPDGQVMVADPGRAQCGKFIAEMRSEGYRNGERRARADEGRGDSGRIMSFTRD
jgi:2-polyprenyl-3-methyl-5-hydroxy-6-metoxy-1,4-benzoquinol methylase